MGLNPGWRALQSLQMCNNEEIVKSLIEPFFSLGYGPQDVDVVYKDNYLEKRDDPQWNLRYDREAEETMKSDEFGKTKTEMPPDVYTVDSDRIADGAVTAPVPAVNPIMGTIGDAISLNPGGTAAVPNSAYLFRNDGKTNPNPPPDTSKNDARE